jgi:serine/threonine protein kinase/Flp pilus assembly protein TadD
LVNALAEEMRQRWVQGDPVRAEEFLQRHPDLWDNTEQALELIYEEICLRQEHCAGDAFAELEERFPQWRPHLEVMRDCHRLLEKPERAPSFPEVGARVGDFYLLKLLGRGANGWVFLASQPNLADRPVVVKLTPIQGEEHLHLARLQHTHIMPLYGVYDDAARNLRVLCMPYYGGLPLDQLLEQVSGLPFEQRTGEHLLTILRASGAIVTGPAQITLSRLSYPLAMTWIGMCLAEALHYAHEGGLVHFDLKPSNVLIAADGQPMLLDFHLAREPIDPSGPPPDRVGGTSGYMPPEQELALAALSEGKPIPLPVDHRADIFALGAVLYQALGGQLPYVAGVSPPLCQCQADVSPGLSDIVARCLALEASSRYPNAGALADDLRRHLHDQPLKGVRTRSFMERYRKWRRRSPTALRTSVLVVVLGSVGALTVSLVARWNHLMGEADLLFKEGRRNWHEHKLFKEAEELLTRGLENARTLPWRHGLVQHFEVELQRVHEAQEAAHRSQELAQLHMLAERVRGVPGVESFPRQQLVGLEQTTRALWNKRRAIAKLLEPARTPGATNDFLELALFAADVQVRLAPAEEKRAAGLRALATLDEIEELFGSQVIVQHERQRRRRALQLDDLPQRTEIPQARTAWEHCFLGKSFLESNDLTRALEHLREAQALEPQGFWTNFYKGLCAFRLGRHADSLAAFSVCIGVSPTMAVSYHNRALAYTALGLQHEALIDYDQALHLDPNLGPAALNRGMLHFQAKQLPQARADLERALELGAEPKSTVYYDLAMVHLAANDSAGAGVCLEKALQYERSHAQARLLLERLKSNPQDGQKNIPP